MLKLAKLPDRTPVKLTILIPPDLDGALRDYAAIYAETYGQYASVADLLPGIIQGFLDSDRHFAKLRREVAASASPAKGEVRS